MSSPFRPSSCGVWSSILRLGVACAQHGRSLCTERCNSPSSMGLVRARKDPSHPPMRRMPPSASAHGLLSHAMRRVALFIRAIAAPFSVLRTYKDCRGTLCPDNALGRTQHAAQVARGTLLQWFCWLDDLSVLSVCRTKDARLKKSRRLQKVSTERHAMNGRKPQRSNGLYMLR